MLKESLKQQLSDVAFQCWIEPIEPVKLENNRTYLCASSPFHKNILENQYHDKIISVLQEILGFEVELSILTPEQAAQLLDQNSDLSKTEQDPIEDENYHKVLDFMEVQQNELNESLKNGNYDYTFDTFIIGSSNNFAYAACKAVAQNKATAYNPLFIYGPSGLGKTHLLHAIKHEFSKNNSHANIIYVNSESFINEFIAAIGSRQFPSFHAKYRKADILLVDDIQFIAGKERMQEEFFHTFNQLHQLGNQIVLTSDRPPKDIKTLEDRLKTRFEWGLLTDIGMPDLETRIAIIKRKADLLNIKIPDEVAHYIADKLRINIRQLEGAVKKIKAYKYYSGSNPSLSLAQTAIREILTDNQPEPVTVEKIIEEVGKTYSVSPEDIRSNKRSSKISIARQVSIYVVREVTQMSQSAIGNEFGGRDHATIVYALKKIQKIIEQDSHTKAIVSDIIKNIQDH